MSEGEEKRYGPANPCCGYVGLTISQKPHTIHAQIDPQTGDGRVLLIVTVQCCACGKTADVHFLSENMTGNNGIEAEKAFAVVDAERMVKCG